MENFGNFDYIIVGGGSAGCVLANRLSENPKNSVLLLEAGGKDNHIWIHIPVGYLYNIGNPRTDWCYSTESEAGLNNRKIGYPRGRVLGGCSSINGMIYMRGQSQDYDNWSALGNDGWAWDDVLPYFKKSEKNITINNDIHGQDGEWRVEDQRLSWDVLEAFSDACEEAGIPKTKDFNSGNNEGVGYFQVNQRKGVRWNTSKGFLRPAKNRKNLTVLTKSIVQKVIITDGRATGVQFENSGSVKIVNANNEVVLSAGAIGSPQILMLSGVGPAVHLKESNIEVVHALEGVGGNLQDHLQLRCTYGVSGVNTLNEQASTLWGKAKIGLEYMVSRSGPMSMAPSQLGAFAKSDPSLDFPDLEYHVQPLSLPKFGEPLDKFPAFTASVCNLRPSSRGTVRLKSSNPKDAPMISPNYLSTATDRGTAIKSIQLTRKIVNQKAMKKYLPMEVRPGEHLQSDFELAQAAGDIGTTIFHPVGTAKMGNDPMAVVDAQLKVHGINGLRVVDASVMPTITSGNTNSPTIMIAEKAADLILRGI